MGSVIEGDDLSKSDLEEPSKDEIILDLRSQVASKQSKIEDLCKTIESQQGVIEAQRDILYPIMVDEMGNVLAQNERKNCEMNLFEKFVNWCRELRQEVHDWAENEEPKKKGS